MSTGKRFNFARPQILQSIKKVSVAYGVNSFICRYPSYSPLSIKLVVNDSRVIYIRAPECMNSDFQLSTPKLNVPSFRAPRDLRDLRP